MHSDWHPCDWFLWGSVFSLRVVLRIINFNWLRSASFLIIELITVIWEFSRITWNEISQFPSPQRNRRGQFLLLVSVYDVKMLYCSPKAFSHLSATTWTNAVKILFCKVFTIFFPFCSCSTRARDWESQCGLESLVTYRGGGTRKVCKIKISTATMYSTANTSAQIPQYLPFGKTKVPQSKRT